MTYVGKIENGTPYLLEDLAVKICELELPWTDFSKAPFSIRSFPLFVACQYGSHAAHSWILRELWGNLFTRKSTEDGEKRGRVEM